MDRFQILKASTLDGLYAIFDSENQSIVATADALREAQQVIKDINQLLNQDRIVDEALKRIGITE